MDPLSQTPGATLPDSSAPDAPCVKAFRQIVMWPVQLMPRHEKVQIQPHWESLAQPGTPWKPASDAFSGEDTAFGERHYKEFVSFLPYVQRFLYGESRAGSGGHGDARSPIRLFRRSDIARVRIVFPGQSAPSLFDVARVELYFFYDIDIALLAIEIAAADLTLNQALDTLYRFGRGYPTHWEASGRGGHCAERVEWLSHDGTVLCASDYENRDRYLDFVHRHRMPCVASHWEYLLYPLVPHQSELEGAIRYREIENNRMPFMSYLALYDKAALTRGDLVRLALVTRPGDSQTLPFSERFLQDFEYRYCYDRYWEDDSARPGMGTRFMCNGYAFTVIGDAGDPSFTDAASGVLSQFRHQHFLLCLIAHFHKAALLMLSDRLVVCLGKLDILQPQTIRSFKRSIRQTSEIFLRFTHRYWFHAVSEQAAMRDIFKMWTAHLGTDALYEEVRQEIQDMAHYLDSDQLRRQADTVVRLTVVTTFGLIGSITTSFLGINLIAEADQPLGTKIVYFLLVFLPILILTLYTIAKSKGLAEFLEAVSDERIGGKQKLDMLLNVWKRRHKPS